MKKWVLKAIVQKTISYLPGSRHLNYFFQKYVTKGVYLSDEYFFDRLSHAKTHIESYEKLGKNQPLSVTLELGTGWYPIVPISLFLSGANDINTIDISPLLTKETLGTTIKRIVDAEQKGDLAKCLKISAERLSALKQLHANYEKETLETALEKLHIKYHLKDARSTGFAARYFELITSNNTFEHIYPVILEPILEEFKRIIKPGGVLSHAVDMSDHFAHFDKSINVFNFLRFSDAQWKWIDNSIQPQSRLRVSDYRVMYKKLDIPITIENDIRGNVDDLRKIKINRQYNNVAIADVSVVQCYFASLMP